MKFINQILVAVTMVGAMSSAIAAGEDVLLIGVYEAVDLEIPICTGFAGDNIPDIAVVAACLRRAIVAR